MGVLGIIKKRRTIRKYFNRSISLEVLNEIIEAGVWGPSIFGSQPWEFIVIENKLIIGEVYSILLRKLKTLEVGGRFVFRSSLDAILGAQVLIAVYNSRGFEKFAAKLNETYVKFAKVAEISAISAAVQNMILVSESLGVGSCWLDTPTFCEKKINKLFGVEEKLIAILTFGYPAEKGKRSPRKSINTTVKYIK